MKKFKAWLKARREAPAIAEHKAGYEYAASELRSGRKNATSLYSIVECAESFGEYTAFDHGIEDAHVLNAYQAAEIADYRGRCDNYRNDLCSARLIEAALRVGVHKATGLPTDYTDTSHLNAIDDLKRMNLDDVAKHYCSNCATVASQAAEIERLTLEVEELKHQNGCSDREDILERKLDAARVAAAVILGGTTIEWIRREALKITQEALAAINGSEGQQ